MTTPLRIWAGTWLFGAYSWIPLFKQQFILDKTMRRIYDLSRIISGRLWISYSMELEDWSVIKQKLLGWKRLISKNLRGDRQAYCAAELIRSPMPKPTSSPIQCFVWARWDMIRVQLGRTELNCIQRIIASKNWIASTFCRRSSSGNSSQDSRRWTSSKRFNFFSGRYTVWTWAVQRQDLLHFNVLRQCLGRRRKHKKVCSEFYYNCEVRSQIPTRSLVFLGTWIRKVMVRDLFW